MAIDLDGLSEVVIQHLSRLPGYKLKKRGEHWFCCISHDDSTASASYSEEKRGWKCFGCSAKGGVVSLAKALAIDIKPFGKDDPPTTYEYRDRSGNVLTRKTRFYKDGIKAFFMEHTDADGEVMEGEGEPTLYNLPELLAAIKRGETVYIVNGEKASDAMTEAGVTATCGPHGENAEDWREFKFYKFFKGADSIVIVRDIDDTGRKFAYALADNLRKGVRKVSIVTSATKRPSHDAFDHLRAGFTPAQFHLEREWVKGFDDLVSFNGDFREAQVEFLWRPYLPKGRAVLLDADGGTGKSSFCLGLAAGGSHGVTPVTGAKCETWKTLYLIGDADKAHDYETVYRASGGQCGFLSYKQGVFRLDDDGLRRLEEQIEIGSFGLVVIDVLFYYIRGPVENSNDFMDSCEVGRQLGLIAERTGCCILALRHTTKGAVGRAASELGMGSAAFRDTFRGQLVMRKHPEERGLIVVTDEKGSILVTQGEPFAFRRTGEHGAIEYVKDFVNPFDPQYAPGRPAVKTLAARDFLIAELTEGDQRVSELRNIAECRGIHAKQLYKAKDELRIIEYKDENSRKCWSYDPLAEGAV